MPSEASARFSSVSILSASPSSILSKPRRCSARISASSVRRILTSQVPGRAGAAASRPARAARASMASVTRAVRQVSAWRTTATPSREPDPRTALLRLGPPSAIAPTLEGSGFVSVDDFADQLAADDIGPGESDVLDLLDALEDVDRLDQA